MATLMVGATTVTSVLLPRIGGRPLVAVGMLLAGGGLAWLSQIDVGSTYLGGVL